MKWQTVVLLILSGVLLVAGIAGTVASRPAAKREDAGKKEKKKYRLFFALLIFALWLLVGTLISQLSGLTSHMSIEFSLFSERIELFGVSFAQTTVLMWGIIAVVLVLALLFRFAVFPKFKQDRPTGLQNIMELSVEAMESFAKNTLGEKYGGSIAAYMYSLAVFMVLAAFSELLGFRPPTADIVVTLAMGLITFALINIYGFRVKGFGGRIKALSQPTPVILPMKILSDVAVPISLACRLFGNMLGGMIVMHLLKSALGGYSAGIPGVAGLYFNLFHPIIQTYIFIILSLTFINEAIE